MTKQYQFTEKLLARSNGQTLYQHTKEVVDYAEKIYGDGQLKDELRLAAAFHDLGKAQEVYQRLYGGENVGRREHAVASAWICRFLYPVYRNINCIVARLVESHHKGFHRSTEATSEYFAMRDAMGAIQKIIRDGDLTLEILESHGINIQNLESVNKMLEKTVEQLKICPERVKLLLDGLSEDSADADLSSLIEVRKALGALVVADSLSASGFKPEDIEVPRKEVSPNEISVFLSNKNTNCKIDQIRAEIGREVEKRAKTADLNQRVFTIALPTGAGKTLHSLRFATILRGRIHKEIGQEPPRILYVMPFTTVIDQAFDVFEGVFGDRVEKRHYLTDKKENEDVPEEVGEIANLMYQSEITVTTYVQFYSALVGNRRRDAIRSLALRNRIIILDEVQAIPHSHWSIMKELIKGLARDNWIILMSATVPKYVVPENKAKIVDLDNVPNKEIFDRHIFVQKEFDNYKSVVEDAVERYLGGKSVAIVVNTVRTAEEMYVAAKDVLLSKGIQVTPTESGAEHRGGKIIYLSTYVPPFARRNRISCFKNHVFAITTQVIEAGVDVSVDVLYREFSPVDSIVQAAGRCNRNGDQEKGEVVVFRTEDTRKKFKNVYGSTLWTATTAVLGDLERFTGDEVDKILMEYYDNVKCSMEDLRALTIAKNSVKDCSFELDLKIIESIPKSPVAVMYPKARKILEKLKGEYEKKERDRKVISKLFKELGNYVINVYIEQAKRFDTLSIGGNILHIVDPNDKTNYVEDIGILYNPLGDQDAFEDRLV